MENWRGAILSKLEKYHGFKIDTSDHHITVSCNNPERFDVSMHTLGKQFQVNFDGWHESFETEESALSCFAFGLSQECRLKVVKRGTKDCSWNVQAWQENSWIDDTTTGLVFSPYWLSKKVEYRYNVLKVKDV